MTNGKRTVFSHSNRYPLVYVFAWEVMCFTVLGSILSAVWKNSSTLCLVTLEVSFISPAIPWTMKFHFFPQRLRGRILSWMDLLCFSASSVILAIVLSFISNCSFWKCDIAFSNSTTWFGCFLEFLMKLAELCRYIHLKFHKAFQDVLYIFYLVKFF